MKKGPRLKLPKLKPYTLQAMVCIAAIALIGIFVCIHVFREQTSENSPAESSVEEIASADLTVAPAEIISEQAEAESVPDPDEPVTITVTAVGDCTLGTDEGFEYDTSFNAAYYDAEDPGIFLENVYDVFSSDDLTIVNFEGTLSERGEREDKTYAFRGAPSFVQVLTAGSVEAANLANNHSFDYGWDAYEDTKEILADAGITSFGYDRSAVVEINGIKVGLTGTLAIYDEYDSKDGMVEQIEWVKEQGAELIISSIHWGEEGEYTQDDVQEYLGHAAVDAGADLVIGHHPHRLQPVEIYKGKHIVYSLGNFCFGGNRYPSDMDSAIYRQTFTFVGGTLTDDDDSEIIPCSISSAEDYNNYRPRIVDGDAAERVRGKIYTF